MRLLIKTLCQLRRLKEDIKHNEILMMMMMMIMSNNDISRLASKGSKTFNKIVNIQSTVFPTETSSREPCITDNHIK